MSHETGARFDPEINGLIRDLDGPDYITYKYESIGMRSLVILRGVFRADKSYLGDFFGRTLSKDKDLSRGKDVLDLGCGCGILGLICGLNGARSVRFSDVNPEAIKNSKINSLLLEVENVGFSTGNMFDALPAESKFDLIVFNPPSITGVPSNPTEAAFVREDSVIQDFYRLYPVYLREGGAVMMPGSSRFDGEVSPMKMITRGGLRYRLVTREDEEDGNHKYVVSIQK